ncbi:hypothetical protein F5884DRAFT_850540 [Xylogone sp. PMI_703]|nr:hypothetical protein F5884DRAFT_850540 [Xylogone sp. PMI_703]
MDTTNLSTTTMSSPSSSPGLYTPTIPSANRQGSGPLSDGTPHSSPYLHPLQMHRVRETHKAQVEQDSMTGRKLINQYEVINEIGRGVYGKVKLARSLETGEYVAIKIIQRFSKRRRLGRVTVSPEDKTKREIAILKKIRHPNIVGLLEVIDDPELKKIYMVLEHVELGEIVWRKKGVPQVCVFERRRVEREVKGEKDIAEDEKYFKLLERKRQRNELKRARISQRMQGHGDFWSLEHGDDEDEDDDQDSPSLTRQTTHDSSQNLSRSYRSARSNPGSRIHSRGPSRAPSRTSSRAQTPLPSEIDIPPAEREINENPGPLPSIPSHHGSWNLLEGSMYGPYEEPVFRGRSPSMADSIISHMSSVDDIMQHDAFEDDYSYVPCFTMDQARSAFRDTVLGLEYLHYQGIVHRDIKPANLLWTKDHRVKISDFGVSYFGRPIREGEAEEYISESDAMDFDDDLELAKTVGTPAFFAPELCYTDLDGPQPKITEQIDVWSLGITLYCMIFARIPFLAEDEYQLFRVIAKDDVYIPTKRLKPVESSGQQPNASKRVYPPNGLYRDESDLVYEEVDDLLIDLLRRMLIKDPTKRIKLKEVKRHPWTLLGIDNVIGWLDDTDPSRRTAGRRIQVDDRELERAVVPITFLERARSVVKKAVGKVIGVGRNEKGEGSRRRAMSNTTSPGPDSHPSTPYLRDMRRPSLRGDEHYYSSASDVHDYRPIYEHPLAQSVTASPLKQVDESNPFDTGMFKQSGMVGSNFHSVSSDKTSDFDTRSGSRERGSAAAASIQSVLHGGHHHSRSLNNTPLAPHPPISEPQTPAYFTDHSGNILSKVGGLWNPRGRNTLSSVGGSEDLHRARSVDRALFDSEDKHGEPSIALSPAIAPGTTVQAAPMLKHPRPVRSLEVNPGGGAFGDKPLPSPLFFHPSFVQAHQEGYSTSSSPNPLDNRSTPDHKSLPLRTGSATAFESSKRLQHIKEQSRQMDGELGHRKPFHEEIMDTIRPESVECPPSPDRELYMLQGSRESTRAKSSSSVNSISVAAMSPITSPSDIQSSVSSEHLASQNPNFQSVPSLPALMSGASSVSADTEGEFLQLPGNVHVDNASHTTSPQLSKQTSIETEPDIRSLEPDTIPLDADLDNDPYNGDGEAPSVTEDDDSDSDEGLMITRKKSRTKSVTKNRRDTNASVGSTDTAKKVIIAERHR